MDFAYILETRIPPASRGKSDAGGEGKSGGKSKSKAGKTDPFGSGSGGGGFGGLPMWARILIVVLIVLLVIWVSAFIYYLVKESNRKRQGKKFRFGHALLSATKVVTGIWFVLWVFKTCTGKTKKKGTYSKIDEAGQGKVNNTSWYGAPAAAPYAAGGTGYTGAGTDGRYEPMGYTPQYSADNRASMAPSPLPSPSPTPPVTTAVSPPAYTAPPSQAQPAGSAAAYYMPTQPSQTSPPYNNQQASATYVPSQNNYMPQY